MGVLDRPGLARLWVAARRRLEGNGATLTGSPLVLRDLDEAEADVVGGLLARSLRPGADLRVGLERLDDALRASVVGLGLVEVLEALGGPLRDRPADRRASTAASDSLWAAAAEHRAVLDQPPLREWLARLRRSGLIARLAPADPAELLDRALAVLGALPAEGESLARFAAVETGDAHGLDRGQAVGTVVANALAFLDGEAGDPVDAAAWRRRWGQVGVVCDALSCDVLALNLPVAPGDDGRLARWVRGSAAEGDPGRLTLRQLENGGLHLAAAEVFVCENPAIVAAAADQLGAGSAPLVCTAGVPNTAVTTLLGMVLDAGGRLRAHADFDWSGVRIAGALIDRLDAVPWRFGGDDYAAAVPSASAPLVGARAPTPWDPGLADRLATTGIAVHEELVIESLLADLDRSGLGPEALAPSCPPLGPRPLRAPQAEG